MTTAPPSPTADRRASRTDGADARRRLLHTALALFAAKGHAKTSTREIAQAAGMNIAAISYYFGDKAGLYAACFSEPLGSASALIDLYDQRDLPLHGVLRIFFTSHVEPLKGGVLVQQCLRLHIREMLEPTSIWAEELERDVKEPHRVLVAALCRHYGLRRADDDIHRLAFSIGALALHLFVSHEIIEAERPSLLRSNAVIDQWTDRLVGYAEAMVQAEAQRRGLPTPTPTPTPTATTPRKAPAPHRSRTATSIVQRGRTKS